MEIERDKPLYAISVVAKMLDVSQQTLRIYEKEMLVAPRRTEKKTRLYSQRDIDDLRRIITLHQELGVNLAGVDIILRMQRKMEEMQGEYQRMIETVREKFQMDFEPLGEDSTELVPLDPRKLMIIRKARMESRRGREKG